ncbi:exosome complex component RRP46 isoform X2 [Vanessa atalanta]|uniref:exosome complex component RRP46 isoform X2 n=1 Tax=Vanessa atalanta TaxID=42275 RepID=UPI001FCD4571|nr:exosome complex component RRP46 isoform X2 [Vanessa atalanta]
MENEDENNFKLRPMKCELNYLSKSDGSAILAQGETVVLVSVNGPLDIKSTSQSIEKATLEVLFCTKGGKPSVADRFKENIIRQTCETAILGCLYPRTGISLTIQELEDFGGLLTCTINCACLALLNSGIAMRHMVAAVCCAVSEEGNLVLEPSYTQVQSATALLYFVFDSRERNLVTGFTEGSFSENTYEEALARCRLASDVVFDFYRDIVKQYSDVI